MLRVGRVAGSAFLTGSVVHIAKELGSFHDHLDNVDVGMKLRSFSRRHGEKEDVHLENAS